MAIVCYEINSVKNTFSSPSLSLSQLLSAVYIFSFIYLFIHFFSQSAKQPVSETPLTYFPKEEEVGLSTGLSASVREVT